MRVGGRTSVLLARIIDKSPHVSVCFPLATRARALAPSPTRTWAQLRGAHATEQSPTETIAPVSVARVCLARATQAPTTLSGVSGALSGILSVTNFSIVNNALQATGTLVGTFTNAATGATTPINTTFSALLQGVSATCTILTLTLGPLHLDLLGLLVDLNQVVLTITAQPGPGNLLGNLLCDVANLLNSGGGLSTILTQLQSLLNQILAAL